MKLLEVIDKIDDVGTEATIYAKEPWDAESLALALPEPEEGGLPEEAKRLGLRYFLEVFIIQDFLQDWALRFESEPSNMEKCTRMIQYAIRDA